MQGSGAAGGRQPAAGGSKQPGSSQGANGKGSREAPWETGDRPDHPVAVIIVPVRLKVAQARMRLPSLDTSYILCTASPALSGVCVCRSFG